MKKLISWFVVSLYCLSACSLTSEVITPPAAPVAEPTFTPVPTQTIALDPFTVTPTPVMAPTDYSPVLYGGKLYETPFFILVGGVSQNVWLAADMSVARYAGEATYSLHSLMEENKYFMRGKAPENSPTCQGYFVGTDAGLGEAGFVGVFDGWTITKRPVTELTADVGAYEQVVIDWLTAEDVQDPQVGELHVFRVDIEGDGVDEVFINATHLDGSQHTTRDGDYSIILMRKVAGNEALTFEIVSDIYRSEEPELTFPHEYSIANFIDLNQDGILEVVVDVQKWEGLGAIVYQLDDQDVIETLRAIC